MFAETKLRRGMIFTRIRVGECQTLGYGEKIHVSPPCFDFPISPCFIQPRPLRTAAVSWGSYGWEWSVVGLLVLAHMHTPPTWLTSWWQAKTTAITPQWRFHSLHGSAKTFTHFWLLCIISIVCSCLMGVWLFSHIGFFPVLVSCSQKRGAISTIIHLFPHEGIEWVSIYIWDLVWIFSHALGSALLLLT